MLLQSAVASQEKTEGNGTAVNNHRLLETDNTTESEREIHTFDSYLPEYQSTREAAFLYNEPQEPEDTVVHVANMMHLVPPHHVFSGYSLLKQIDISVSTVCQSFLHGLRCRLTSRFLSLYLLFLTLFVNSVTKYTIFKGRIKTSRRLSTGNFDQRLKASNL